MPKDKRNSKGKGMGKKSADQKYAKRSGVDTETAAELGKTNGQYNAWNMTQKDKERQEEREQEKNQ